MKSSSVQRPPGNQVLGKDGRYDYIETGSLISIHKNTKDINIPSEEHRVEMFPMDYEESDGHWVMRLACRAKTGF